LSREPTSSIAYLSSRASDRIAPVVELCAGRPRFEEMLIVGPTREVADELARHQVSVWHGHSYALELIDALGLTERGGGVRASIVRYNDTDDIDRLLAVVATLAA